MLPQTLIFALSGFVLLGSSSAVSFYNDRPFIGILTEETNSTIDPKATSTLLASYVKFIEASGGRVVPVWIRKPKSYYQDILSKLDGILLPGGGNLIESSGYGRAGKMIFDIAVQMNDKGDFFPVWGTCLGFELLNYLAAKQNVMKACQALDWPTNVKFVEGMESSRMFKYLSPRHKKIMETENVTYNNHHWCLTPANYSAYQLDKYFRVLATSRDSNGVEFVSIVEAYKYPFYGVAFHPEKTIFEWSLSKKIHKIPHTSEAVEISQFLSRFFVFQTKNTKHFFPDKDAEDAALIYNYNPVYTGKIPEYPVIQTYFFRK